MTFFDFYLLASFLFSYEHVLARKTQNVLFIVADDLRPNIGAYGDKDAVTPNIDQLSKNGVTFHRAYAQQALCAPSRNSFLTSRRPDTLHLYDFYNYWRTFTGNFTTLPQYFKENSYYTKSIGKIFHPGISSNFTDDYPLSWSELPWHPSTEIYANKPTCPTNKGLFQNLVCPVNVSEQPEKTLPDIQSVQEAVKFLKSRKHLKNKPFFLAVGLYKPHIPLKFPKHYEAFHPIHKIKLPGLTTYPPTLPSIAWNPWTDIRQRHDIASLNVTFPFASLPDKWTKKIRQAYFSSVTYIDDLLGDLLKALKKTNFHRNTIVVLLGDHGWSLGEHGEWAKYSNYDVATRVPLIFRIPNITYFPEKEAFRNVEMHVKDLVELVDVFPTLVDLAGLKPIPKCPKDSVNISLCAEGRSMLPLILNEMNGQNLSDKEAAKLNWKKCVYSQYPRPGVEPTYTPNSDKPKLHEIKFMGYTVRTERFRYTKWIPWNSTFFKGNWTNVNETELYDHIFDPDENTNLAGRPGLEDTEKMLSDLLKEGFAV